MSKEAMKLALEALESYKGFIDDAHILEGQWRWIDGADNAQTALREALAKPDFWEGYVPEPAQQKPVTRVNLDMTGAMATLPKTGSESVVEYKPVISDVGADTNIVGLPDTYYGIVPKGAGKITLHEPAQQEPVACFSVFRSISGERNTRFLELASLPDGEHYFYTSPPVQRTWVSLTDEERVDLWKATETDNRMVLIDAIEAKLKEKNT